MMINTAAKKKLCWNCEGNVSRDAVNCPYCAVYLHREEDREEEFEEEDFPSHPPSYHPTAEQKSETTIPVPPYNSYQPEAKITSPDNSTKTEPGWFKTDAEWPKVMIPLVLLMAGSIFLLFAVLIGLFSQKGFLTLTWSANTWFIFLCAALPMLYLGWRSLRQISE